MDDSASNQWENWIRENQDKWLLYSRQQTRSEADAQDVLQESILALWQEHTQEPPHPGAVFAAIRFRAMNWARGTQRRQQRQEDYMALVRDEDRSLPYGEDEQELLLAALKTLPEAQAETVTLRIWGGLTFQEIADICHCSIHTISARYRMALEKLQKQLKGTLGK